MIPDLFSLRGNLGSLKIELNGKHSRVRDLDGVVLVTSQNPSHSADKLRIEGQIRYDGNAVNSGDLTSGLKILIDLSPVQQDDSRMSDGGRIRGKLFPESQTQQKDNDNS